MRIKHNCLIINENKAIPADSIAGVSVDCEAWLRLVDDNLTYNGYFTRDGMGTFYCTDSNNNQERVWTSDLNNVLSKKYHSDQEISFNVNVSIYLKHTKEMKLKHCAPNRILHLDGVDEFKEELIQLVKKAEVDILEDVISIIYDSNEQDNTLVLKD